MATNESLLKTLGFSGGSPAYAKVLLAFETKGSKGMEDDEGDGGKQEPLGMAIYFTTYSTWRAAPGIHLEDLFVREQHRGRGIGTALLAALAQEVGKIGGARLEWNVLKCEFVSNFLNSFFLLFFFFFYFRGGF
jgi:GNAT superfamily N-acetyltransferase